MSDERELDLEDSELSDLEAWIEFQASSTGVDREQVLDDLVSAYWALNEIIGLLGHLDTGEHSLPEELPEPPTDRQSTEALTEKLEGFENRLDTLQNRVEELEGADVEVDVSEYEARISDLREETNRVERELVERNQETLTYVKSEFANLRPIIEHLLDHTDTLDVQQDSLSESVDDIVASVEDVDEFVTSQRHLGGLLQEATRQDVERATCEHCEETVLLSMLTTPECPTCDSTFTGIEHRRSRFWRKKPVLRTEDDPESNDSNTLTWVEQS